MPCVPVRTASVHGRGETVPGRREGWDLLGAWAPPQLLLAEAMLLAQTLCDQTPGELPSAGGRPRGRAVRGSQRSPSPLSVHRGRSRSRARPSSSWQP